MVNSKMAAKMAAAPFRLAYKVFNLARSINVVSFLAV